MNPSPPRVLAVCAILFPLIAGNANAQEPNAIATLSERVLFVTSGGYWEEAAETNGGDAGGEAAPATDESTEKPVGAPDKNETPAGARGYYRLIATRGEDNRSRLDLQQIALTPDGPKLALSIGIEELNALGAYVTDIRPENSTGQSSGPGFAAFVYLKTNPAEAEPQTWTLFVDEFGEIVVEQSSN